MVDVAEAVKLFFIRYVDFEGRSTRSEFWWVFLVWWVSALILVILLFGVGMNFNTEELNPFGWIMALLFLVFYFGTLIPGIALRVRRFHDQDLSGWLYLLRLIPYMGGLVILVFMVIEGKRGPNRFGPDPLGADPREIFD